MGQARKSLGAIILLGFSIILTSCGVTSSVIHRIQDYATEHAIGEADEFISTVSSDKYAYNTLSYEEQLVYDQMYYCIDNFEPQIPISTKSEEVIRKSYESLIADNGSHFWWIHGYSVKTYRNEYDGYISGVEFIPDYTMTKEEKEAKEGKIHAVFSEWMAECPTDGSDYEKSKFVYEKLINEVDYDTDAPDNQTIVSVFLNKRTVCQGYANAASYFFDALNIPSVVVTGIAGDESHAWNLVELDGDYYYFDATWGNSEYKSGDTEKKQVNYNYLNITSKEIENTHFPGVSFPLPSCTSVKDNYFVNENLLFSEENYEKMGDRISLAYNGNEDGISLKFTTEDLYNMAVTHLLTEKKFSEYCGGLSRISYIANPEDLILTLNF